MIMPDTPLPTGLMAYHGEINNEEGRRGWRPWFVFVVFLADRRSGERRFAVRHQHVRVGCLHRERLVLFLEPD